MRKKALAPAAALIAAFFAATSFSVALPPQEEDFRLVQTAEVAYGQVRRYENGRGDGIAVAVDKGGRVLSSTPYAVSANADGGLSSYTVETKQTDVYGNEVSVGADFDGGEYILADPLRNIYVYHADNGTGQILRNDMLYRSETGTFDDAIAITSYLNLIKVYDFYAGGGTGAPLRGADGSHDEIAGNERENNESRIALLVHYGLNEENAQARFDKSYNAAILGVGDGKEDGYLYQLGRAADIMAHEYQHTVTHFRVNFSLMNESGAIDEAISDMIGALAEGHELTDERFWTMGEDAAAKKEGGVRSMKEPTGNYASSFDAPFPACHEKHDHTLAGCDCGGVHYNSTILTHAQYLMWEEAPEYFTKERIGALWYAVIPLLGANATFEDFKTAFVQTAENLGFGRSAVNVIRKHLGMELLQGEFTVTFVNADGEELYKTFVDKGGTAVYSGETPALPSTEEYDFIFDGWDGDLENITQNVTLKAKYKQTLRTYPVRFYSKGLLWEEEAMPYGAEVPLPVPTREGYIFGGWYLDDAFTEKAETVTLRGEIHLYAKWEKKPPLGTGAIVALVATGVVALAVPTLLILLRRYRKKKK